MFNSVALSGIRSQFSHT